MECGVFVSLRSVKDGGLGHERGSGVNGLGARPIAYGDGCNLQPGCSGKCIFLRDLRGRITTGERASFF